MSRKLTKEEFINREPDLLNSEYDFIGEYINATTKTLFKHNMCGYEWKVTPGNFHQGRRCPRCAGVTKLTTEEFIEREKDIQSGEYKILEEYKNARTQTLFKHVTCGYEWNVTPHSFHSGRRCPKCANQKNGSLKRLTKEEFINREPDLLSGEYMFIGNYVAASTKTLFKHNTCGYEWMIKPNNFHTGQRCPKCVGNIKLTKEEFCEREEDILSGEYEFIGEYTNASTKTLFRHNTCGQEWEIRPGDFHRGNRCSRCGGTQKLTKREFCEREEDIQSGEYEMLGKYINITTKTLFKHNACGYEWEIKPNNFRMGNRCPKCAGNIKLTKEEFCEREEDILSGEYQMLGKYINITTKTLFKHNACGYEYQVVPEYFHRGTRCPKCNESRGEKSIANILEEINIPFESQKRFNSCKYKRLLPFDFYVNNSFLIEYDGEQHFKPTDFAGKGDKWADKNFKSRQLRDNIKTQWAKDNGIPLVRIPYTEFDNIEQIIKDNIEKYSIQKAG